MNQKGQENQKNKDNRDDRRDAALEIAQYVPIVMKEARRLSGGDGFTMDDLVQEGIIAALAAWDAYDSARGSVASFVRACARNRMISYLRQSGRESPMEDEALIESIDSASYTEDQQVALEIREAMLHLIDSLSSFEQRVLAAYLSGGSVAEAARILCDDRKKVDNALQRIRNKARNR